MNAYKDFIEKMYMVFSEVDKPGLDEMTPHRCIECNEIRDQLHAYDKRDVPNKLLIYHGDALPLLSPKALRYYFPRYIEFGLLHQEYNAFDSCLYQLALDTIDDYAKARMAVFTSNEKAIFREYLELRRSMEDAEFDEEYIVKGLAIWV